MRGIKVAEQWERWEPIPGVAAKYYAESMCNTIEGVKILLFDDNDQKLVVTFANPVNAYRSVNESFRLNLINTLDAQYGSDFYGKWTFFKVTNSAYVKQLSEKSGIINNEWPLQHFSFLTADAIIDIINTCEPEIEFLTHE